MFQVLMQFENSCSRFEIPAASPLPGAIFYRFSRGRQKSIYYNNVADVVTLYYYFQYYIVTCIKIECL